MTSTNRAARGVSSALAMLGVAAAVHAQPVVLYVDDDAAPGGDGSSWFAAFRDLQMALAVASQVQVPMEVRIAGGVYHPDMGTGSRGASFRVSYFNPVSSLTLVIAGGFAGLGGPDPDARDPAAYPTVLSGDLNDDDHLGPGHLSDNSFCVLKIIDSGESLILDGLTVQGGNSNGLDPDQVPYPEANGAGVTVTNLNSALDSGPVFRNLRILGNTAEWGAAGLFALADSLTLDGCVFEENAGSGTAAGAVKVHSGWSDVVISDCAFRRNHAYRGGGVEVKYSYTRIRRCTFEDNAASSRGGGIYAEWSLYVLENCLFARNEAAAGGAIYASSDLRLVHCTLTDNTADYGGALYTDSFSLEVIGSVLWGNRAFRGTSVASSRLENRITIRDSTVEDGPGGIYGFWDTLDCDQNVLVADPLFRDPSSAAPDYRLMQASPCVDGGDPSVPLGGGLDLDGLPRFVGHGTPTARPDMGCYELQTPDCPADYNGDGYTDGLDADGFYVAFITGDPRADVNRDGYIDGIDYDQFYTWFDLGC